MANDVPLPAKQLFALGPKTEEAVRALFRDRQGSLFPREEKKNRVVSPEDFELLARSLFDQHWSDEEAEKLISHMTTRKGEGKILDIALVSRWVLAHPNDAESVILCMDSEPPQEVEIRKVLPRAGSQKIVFVGSWRLTQKEVVVKRFNFDYTLRVGIGSR